MRHVEGSLERIARELREDDERAAQRACEEAEAFANGVSLVAAKLEEIGRPRRATSASPTLRPLCSFES